MKLDHLTHTLVDLKDPSFLGYPHDYIHAEFVRQAAARTAAPRVLVIGGGGYVLPRWVETYVGITSYSIHYTKLYERAISS